MANAENRRADGVNGAGRTEPLLAVVNTSEISSRAAPAGPDHEELVRDLRNRIENLSAQAATMKIELPREYGDAFERIADGLSLLIGRLDKPTEEKTKGAGEAHATCCIPQRQDPIREADRERGIDAKAEPPTPSLEDPWDPAAADALAQLYDIGEAALSAHVAVQDEERARVAALVPAPAAEPESDRRWLEARFTEIARTIERAQRPAGAAVPAHEIEKQPETSRSQVDRLAAIESQLADLKGKLSDEQIIRMLTAIMPTDQELGHLAEVAAEKVAKRIAGRQPAVSDAGQGQAGACGDQQGGPLEDLIRQFISEQGRSEQQIAEALGAFQEAMEHVLDRIDAIEAGQAAGSMQYALENGDPAPVAKAAGRDAAVMLDRQSAILAPGTTFDGNGTQGAGREERHTETPTRSSRPEAAGDGQPETAADTHRSLLEQPSAKPDIGAVRPRYLVAASLAAFLLAGYWLVSGPKLRPVGEVAGEIAESPTSIARSTGAPSSDDGKLELRTGSVPPGMPQEETGGSSQGRPPRATRSDPQIERENDSTTQDAKTLPEAPGDSRGTLPSVSGPIGITVQQGNTLSPEDIVRLRQRQRMASLSSRLGQEAAAQSTAAPGTAGSLVTASADATEGDDGGAKRRSIELPPAMIGPMSLRLAAARGDASAQFAVAARFAEGKGVEQDFEEAAAWYQRAAAQGHAAAQYRLATLYERGLGVKGDPARARLWYGRAAEQGNVKAMHNLAVLYVGREGSNPDYATAAKWFTEAAERGLADSQYNLGVLYESGLGLARDVGAAYRWYALAAQSGDKEAVRRRDLLRSKLDKATLKRLDADLANWRPRSVDRQANDAQAAGDAWRHRASN